MASSSSSPLTTQANFAPSKLCPGSSREEYDLWKELVLHLLETMNLLEFTDGRLPAPPETSSQALREWKRIDRLVKDCILEAVSDELLLAVISLKTSRDVLLELETMFTRTTPLPAQHPFAHQGPQSILYIFAFINLFNSIL